MTQFDKQYRQLHSEETFGLREVGISHPDNAAFVKIADNGVVEITACPGLTYIMNPIDKSVTIVADKVRYILGGKEVFQINDLILNTDATNYAEPTFLKKDVNEHTYLYDGTVDYLEEVDHRVVIDPETNSQIGWEEYVDKYGEAPTWNGSHFE